MKKLLITAALLFSTAAFGGVPVTGGAFTNPAINTILADSGQVTDNTHEIYALCASTVAAVIVLEHRDAANATNVWSQYLILPANTTTQIVFIKWVVTTLNERVRFRLNAAITGSVQCSVVID